MACCTGCEVGTGCETGCSPCAGGACPIPQPAQYFVPNFAPATGCADGSCKLPRPAPGTGAAGPGGPIGFGEGQFGFGASFLTKPWPNIGPRASAFYPAALRGVVPRPSPSRVAQASMRPNGFEAIVNVMTGEPGVNVRIGPSVNAPLAGAVTNGTRVTVTQIGIPEAGAPPGSPMEWWAVMVPGVTWPNSPRHYIRAVGPTGARNLVRVS